MDYLEKLKDPRWQRKRLEVLNIKNFKCEWCQTEKIELHVHHVFYGKNKEPWEYQNCEFMVLCTNCHNELHKDLMMLGLFWSITTKDQRQQIKELCKKILGC